MSILIIDDDGANSRPPTDEEWERFCLAFIGSDAGQEAGDIIARMTFVLSELGEAFAAASTALGKARVEMITASAEMPTMPSYRPIDERRAANPRAPIPERIRRRNARRC